MPLHGRTLGVLLASSVALSGCADFKPEELRCEAAMANVLACCPGVTNRVACEYTHDGNGFPLTTFSFPKVECLTELGCAELVATGACAWIADPAHATAPCP
jgi:hypothetical protein